MPELGWVTGQSTSHCSATEISSVTACEVSLVVGSDSGGAATSALSIFNFRVEGLEFGACVVDFELPIDPALLRVTGRGPHGGFLRKLLGFTKPAVVQTLTRQRTQFVFRDVEPTAVLGRVPKFDPPNQLPCPLRGKRLVKRAHRVRV